MSKHNNSYFSQFFKNHDRESALSNMILLFLGLIICIFAVNSYNNKNNIKEEMSPSIAIYDKYIAAAANTSTSTDMLVTKSSYEASIAQNPKNPWLREKYSNFLLTLGYFGDANENAVYAKKLVTEYINQYGQNPKLSVLMINIDKTIALSEKYMRGQ